MTVVAERAITFTCEECGYNQYRGYTLERDWENVFSGREASLTRRCEQLKRGIKAGINKLDDELMALFCKITLQQAMEFGYCYDGMDPTDFKGDSN